MNFLGKKLMVKFSLLLIMSLGFFMPGHEVLAANATLSLSPLSGTLSTGSNVSISIILNTGGAKTAGTDAAIHFSADKLRLLDIVNGTIYSQYVGKQIDNTGGTAQISGLASPDGSNLFSGTGTLATLNFQVLKEGTATVSIDFTAGSKNDSNVADFATKADILSSVTNGSYTIAAGSGGTTTTTTTTTTNTTENANTQTTTSELPDASTSYPVFILGIMGISLFIAGSFLLKKNY